MNLTEQEKTFLKRLINDKIYINSYHLLCMGNSIAKSDYEEELRQELKELKNLKERLEE